MRWGVGAGALTVTCVTWREAGQAMPGARAPISVYPQHEAPAPRAWPDRKTASPRLWGGFGQAAVRACPPHAAGVRRNRRSCPHRRLTCVAQGGSSAKEKTRRRAGLQGRMNAYLTSRRTAPVNSWRGRPILYSGSASISLSWAIQPTVRASAKMPVNRLTGMPMARCTMPE